VKQARSYSEVTLTCDREGCVNVYSYRVPISYNPYMSGEEPVQREVLKGDTPGWGEFIDGNKTVHFCSSLHADWYLGNVIRKRFKDV
jgi:hypothetical protein